MGEKFVVLVLSICSYICASHRSPRVEVDFNHNSNFLTHLSPVKPSDLQFSNCFSFLKTQLMSPFPSAGFSDDFSQKALSFPELSQHWLFNLVIPTFPSLLLHLPRSRYFFHQHGCGQGASNLSNRGTSGFFSVLMLVCFICPDICLLIHLFIEIVSFLGFCHIHRFYISNLTMELGGWEWGIWIWTLSGFESWFCHLVVVWPWARCSTSLCLTFLICKMGIIIVGITYGCKD